MKEKIKSLFKAINLSSSDAQSTDSKDGEALESETLQRRVESAKFANEELLLQGNSKPKINQQSILFFTTHKCASVYVGNLLRALAEDVGMTPINLAAYYTEVLGQAPNLFSEQEMQEAVKVFHPQGYFFGPLRSPNWRVPEVEKYRILLMLRDPRDVLTSRYFSTSYSHAIAPNEVGEAMLEKRSKALSKPIDEWVLESAPTFLERYELYCHDFLPMPNVHLVKYEDMVNNFSFWLQAVVKSLGLEDASQDLKAQIISEANFDVEEDVFAHKRQVKPGDHLRKLQPETINQLNLIFGEVLDVLQYEKSA